MNLGDGDLSGWAIPTATDIAFAVAILAVISTHLPAALRTFLLTLAVVDDLLAITDHRALLHRRTWTSVPPLAAGPARGVRRSSSSAGSARRGCCSRSPLATWALVHASGVHATVAGVLLGVHGARYAVDGRPTAAGLAEHLEHLVRPISAGFAVPVFAFFAAGVTSAG